MSAPSNRQPWFAIARPTRVWIAAGALAFVTLLAYANSFFTPFVFDGVPAIVENPTIRRLWPLRGVLAPLDAGGLTVSGRPIVNLSFALNHAISGKEVWSYHVANLLIHVLAGLCLMGIVRRTLLLPVLRPRFGGAALPLAFTVATLWSLHPLQTESVTYVVQRAESLMALFYLLTLYAFVRAINCPPLADKPAQRFRGAWLALSVGACLLGMATKEVMVSAPLIVLLYDRTFLSGTFRAAWRARRNRYLALAATWLLLGCLMLGTGNRGGTAGFGAEASSWFYALTQCRAIVRYLGLCFWPHPLVFDYGLATVNDVAKVWPQAALLFGLLAITGLAMWRRPILGFLGVCFFALLAPSSSIVPVVTQTMAEHRMYLPLAVVLVLPVLAVYSWLGRRSLFFWGAAAAGLGALTAARNGDYRSEAVIWADTAAKFPGNARAHNNLGQALFRAGKVDASIQSYEAALRLQPKYPETHYNLGVALARIGRGPAAIEHYETALRFQPDYPEAHNNLGNSLMTAGRLPEAVRHYEEALRRKPQFAEAHSNLGNALLQMGRAPEAIVRFERALELKPDYPEARYNLGNALAAVGRMADALDQYRKALELKPDYAEAHVNAGNALLQLDRPAEAFTHYEKALALNAALPEAQYNLGSVLLQMERWIEAIPRFEAALQLQPDSVDAHRGLGFALGKAGRPREAIPHYEYYLRAKPGDAAARDELAELRRRP